MISWILGYFAGFHENENCGQVTDDNCTGSWEDSGLCVSCFLAHRLKDFWRTGNEEVIANTLGASGPGGHRF